MSQPLLRVLDASALRAWAASSLVDLAAARNEIDALNVYPVPDGDTGTNLYLTFDAAVDALAQVPPDAGPGEVLDGLAKGSFLGARGNSGVILSQALRGLADAVGGSAADALTMAGAFERAVDSAYAAVAEPVEGTMLTVLRSAAAAVVGIDSLPALVAAASRAAREALARTPDQLDVLRQAGVVDAGGRGICVLLDALESVVTGSAPAGATEPSATGAPLSAAASSRGPSYEVMFFLDAPASAIPDLREALSRLGDSVVLGGGDSTWNVHAHVDDVGAAIEAAISVGRPHTIRVTSLRAAEPPAELGQLPAPELTRAVVVVLPDKSLGDLFEAAGAATACGTSGHVTPDEVASVIRTAGARELIVVATYEAGYELARAVAQEMRGPQRRLEVVPGRDPVQALAAVVAHDAGCRFEDDVLQMTAAAARCRHGAVGFGSSPGEVVGTIDGEVVVVGGSQEQVAVEIVDRLLASGGLAISLVCGTESSAGLAGHIEEHVRRDRADIDIVVYEAAHPAVLLVGVE